MNVRECFLLKNVVIGRARNITDEGLFHQTGHLCPVGVVGLGADGLSSSCYGPEAAFGLCKRTRIEPVRRRGHDADDCRHLHQLLPNH